MRYEVSYIETLVRDILEHAGLSEADAKNAADCLLMADMRGVHSHGVVHVKDICARIKAGTIKTSANTKVIQTAPSAVTVDADLRSA